MQGLSNARARGHSFLFGRRLTNVTRLLRQRDVDKALAAVSEKVPDWSGGTRIGTTLEEFNRLWSRRVLAQGAVVLLVTDGLDREGGSGLAREMERLHKSCRRLIWLNRSEEHTSELQSLMRISYAVFCLKKKKTTKST